MSFRQPALQMKVAASRDFIGEFVRCPLPESPVRPTLVVFPATSFHDPSGFRQVRKPVGIQAFGPEGPVKRFHEGIIRRARFVTCMVTHVTAIEVSFRYRGSNDHR